MLKLCTVALQFSEDDLFKKIYSRPFGISIVVAAYEEGSPVLFCIDPAGAYIEYKARAIGSASEAAEIQLEEELNKKNELSETIKNILSILKNIMKDKMTSRNIELNIVDKNGIKDFTPEEIKSYIQ